VSDDNLLPSGAPKVVADSEVLVRACKTSDWKKQKKTTARKLHWRVFFATQWPLQISVFRSEYCNPLEAIQAANASHDTGVCISAARCREDVDVKDIEPEEPPEAHANLLVLEQFDLSTEHKKVLSAEQVGQLKALCVRLAEKCVALDG